MIVTFFGHSNTSQSVQIKLETVLIHLIEKKGATFFYIGNHGNFDLMVKNTLKELKCKYPHINYAVVLAYMPKGKNGIDYSQTIFPECLASVHPKYAIAKRNRWMIEQSDVVVTYVKYSTGGAVQFKELAEKKGKTVINLADD
ncbi:MAG: hypothetical protein IJF40_06470 [Clostridia bacterium]|nr:hypothetical protein [Clostridia bacterium]